MEELPKNFGRYELIELIATGGMAHIFRARLATTGGTEKELVIKRVLPHLAQNRDFIDMFIDEARITMPLNHGNIVQVFEFGQESENYFLAMEYVRGRNLETVLERIQSKSETVPVPVALFIAAEVAKGLDYAHRFRDPQDRPTGIIHRDVSPQNILIGFQGEVKLTDFGIAKAKSRIRNTAQGIIRGKACYLSPEQARCLELDSRSDQFSLGTVLFEMLTGVRPFEGENEVATLENVRNARISSPSSFRMEIPAEVDGAIMKALSCDRDRRFTDLGALQVVLARALGEMDPGFTSASLAEWMRKHFSDDISREVTARNTRERMLQRLDKESREPRSDLSTGEILQMGTLSIKADSDAGSGKKPARGFRAAYIMAPLLVIGLGLATWLGWPTVERWLRESGNEPDAGIRPDSGALISTEPPPGGDKNLNPQTGDKNENGESKEAADIADAGTVASVKPDRRRRSPVRFGFLNINSRPWANVWIDGKRMSKETPLFKVRLRAGRHRLRFFNPELNIEKIEFVRVRAGKTRTISVKLMAP